MTRVRGTLIRQATSDDFSLIRRLEDQIFPEDPWTDGMIAEELASPARAYFIAQIPCPIGEVTCERDSDSDSGSDSDGHDNDGHDNDESVLGYGGVSLGLDADIMTIGVLPSARGVGMGSALVNALIDAATQTGAERIFLEVRESNTAAQKLYEKHGFDTVGRIRRYFRNPLEDAVTMVRQRPSDPSVH
ncbi:ribosomal protein S18-alanine N-acetyltransferase [Schaalia sp. Marseille-Q2122]|uniref:ribosomal protein S18-alanine N-acetyltransferase n=1 Tax=Schaalia sp. Marseille-Q2122 TaxID=2736604 RepID=UPI0015894A5C|nr:ribosomal protein S18-alanine N-acetyltransferase [Schaalia sp. Marseille-Q2122]